MTYQDQSIGLRVFSLEGHAQLVHGTGMRDGVPHNDTTTISTSGANSSGFAGVCEVNTMAQYPDLEVLNELRPSTWGSARGSQIGRAHV